MERNNPDLYVWGKNEYKPEGNLRLIDRRWVDFTLLLSECGKQGLCETVLWSKKQHGV